MFQLVSSFPREQVQQNLQLRQLWGKIKRDRKATSHYESD